MFLVASITPSGRCSASSGAGNGCTGARGARAAPRADLQLSIFMPMMIPTINMTAKPTTATAAPLESAGVAGLHCALTVTSISATEPCHIKAAMHCRTKCIIATPTSTSGCRTYIYICTHSTAQHAHTSHTHSTSSPNGIPNLQRAGNGTAKGATHTCTARLSRTGYGNW